MSYKNIFFLFLIVLVSYISYGQRTAPNKILPVSSKPVKYTVELSAVYTTKSWDGGSDYQEELYGAISVCMAAVNYPSTVQLDYTYKNPADKEIAGGVEPIAQSTNVNGRILWRQTDSPSDRRINLTYKGYASTNYNYFKYQYFSIGSKAVFLFDPKKDPYAAFRLFADMWESDPDDDDEHFNAGKRRISVPISEIPVGTSRTYTLEIFDSSSRHFASINIKAEAGQ